jgi:hypothetical protein
MDSLNRHKKIALDLDGTLIDGAASGVLANYVREHPGKAFYIVTFRTPDQSHDVAAELNDVGLSAEHFDKIISMPPRLARDFDHDQQLRRNAALPRLDQVGPEHLLPGEVAFMQWKGFVAKKLGATVLVDDMPYLAKLGCEKFGVSLVDAATIAPLVERCYLSTNYIRCTNDTLPRPYWASKSAIALD